MKRTIKCGACRGQAILMGVLAETGWYRCRSCGMDSSKKIRCRRLT